MMSDSINEITAALSKAQGELVGAVKDSKNPFFKSNYADLSSVWDSCRAQLSKNGLAVTQLLQESEKGLSLVTLLSHSSGQWMKSVYPVKPVKDDPQGIGSAITYARRYALSAMVGVAQVDDDGEASMGRTQGLPQMKMEQPGPNDGVKDNSYTIPFGKFGGRRLEDVGLDDMKNYINYLEKKADKENKPIVGSVKEFIDRACCHIAAHENSPIGAENF